MTVLNRFLLVLVAVLGAAAYWAHQGALPFGEEAHRPFDFDAEEVTGLTITNGWGTIRLRRERGEWFLTAPRRFPADTLGVATLIANLESIRTAGVLPRGRTAPEDLARAGLDGDTASFAVHVGDRAWRGTIGRPLSIGTRSYLVVEGRRGVFSFVSSMAERFFRKPRDFQDPRAIRCEPALISGVRIEGRGRRLVVREQASGHWRLVEPNEGPVEPEALDRLLNGLVALRAFWLDERSASAPASAQPVTALVGEWTDGRVRREEKLLLWRGQGADRCRAYHVGLSASLKVKGGDGLLALRADGLRDSVVLRIADTPVEAVTVRRRGRPGRIFRPTRRGWEEIGSGPAGEGARLLGELLIGLEHETIRRYHPAARDADLARRFGPLGGELTLEVTFRGRRGAATIRFGRSEDHVIWVRRGDEALVVGVPRAVFAPWIDGLTRG